VVGHVEDVDDGFGLDLEVEVWVQDAVDELAQDWEVDGDLL
jgi:hypothetical protein